MWTITETISFEVEFYCYTAPQRFSCCFHLDSAAVNFQTVANFRWETRTYFIARGRLRDWTGTFSVESVTIFLSLFSCSRTVCDSLARMACHSVSGTWVVAMITKHIHLILFLSYFATVGHFLFLNRLRYCAPGTWEQLYWRERASLQPRWVVGSGGFSIEVLALKHESRIIGQW